MKKLLVVLLASLMVIGLCACSANTNTATTTAAPTAASTAAATAAPAASPAAGEGDNTLTMATNAEFPPYEYHDGDNIVGIDAEIGKAIADKLGMEFEIQDMDFNAIIPAVVSGKADIGMAGMTVTDERKQSVSFSTPYATGIQSVIVADGSKITSVDDLSAEGATYVVGVQQSTTGDIYATDDFGEDRVQRFNKGADAVAALISGKIDCVIIDNEPAKAFVAANAGLKILDTDYANEDYAICIAPDNQALLDKINTALAELTEDGTIKGIIDKYITD